LPADKVTQVPKPAATIEFCEVASPIDHVMPEEWMSLSDAEDDVAFTRHRQSSVFTFVDGHAKLLPLNQTYNPPSLNNWNPATAQ
jgi:prepilin-type processing-associated H-X9-DG protein